MAYKSGTKVTVKRNAKTGALISKTYTTSDGGSTTYGYGGSTVTHSYSNGGAKELVNPAVEREKQRQATSSSSQATSQATSTPTPSKQITTEQAKASGLNVVNGKIQVQSAGDWVKYARATGMSTKEFTQKMHTYNPETAGDWVRLGREQGWTTQQTRDTMRNVYEPSAVMYEGQKASGTSGVYGSSTSTNKTQSEKEYKSYLESQSKIQPSTYDNVKGYAQNVIVSGTPKIVKDTAKNVGYMASTPFLWASKVSEPYAEKIGEYWKTVPDTSMTGKRTTSTDYNLRTGQKTTVSKSDYAIQSQARKEYQGEFVKGFIPELISYPVKHPVQTALLVATPYAVAELGAVGKIAGGRALIKGVQKGLLSEGGANLVYGTGKVLGLGAKAGLGAGVIYTKKQEYKLAMTPKERGAFWGRTTAEGTILLGAGTQISNTLPKPASRYYFTEVRPQVDVIRSGSKYATKEAFELAKSSGKYVREVNKANINPKRDLDYENVKLLKESKTGKRDIARFRDLPKDTITHGGTTAQGTYLDEPVLKGWKGVKEKGIRTTLADTQREFGDLDLYATGKETGIIKSPKVKVNTFNTRFSGGTFDEAFGKGVSFRTGAGIPQDLVKYTDPHAYEEQFNINPYTSQPQKTPSGEQVLPFKTQTAGKLEGTFKPFKSETFFGGGKPNEKGTIDIFYRTTKDFNDLLIQGEQVIYEGKASPSLIKEHHFLTQGYKSIKNPDASIFPRYKGETVKFPIAERGAVSPAGKYEPSMLDSFVSKVPTAPSLSVKTPSFSQPISINPSLYPRFSPIKSVSPSYGKSPSISPSRSPSFSPSSSPSYSPSKSPSFSPSSSPSYSPSASPSFSPSPSPSMSPSFSPSPSSSPSPSMSPSYSPKPNRPTNFIIPTMSWSKKISTFKPYPTRKLTTFKPFYTPTLHASLGGVKLNTKLSKKKLNKTKFTGLEQRGTI